MLSRCYLLLVVLISFVIFQAGSLEEVIDRLGVMFGVGVPLASQEGVFFLRDYGGILLVAVIGATPLAKNLLAKINSGNAGKKIFTVLEPVYLAAAVFVVTSFLVKGSYNPFLYFRF